MKVRSIKHSASPPNPIGSGTSVHNRISSKIIRVVGAAIFKNGLMLCARRGPGRSLAGYWEFPGGKIESDESPQQALIREIKEELGCTIRVGEEIVTSDYSYDFGIVRLSTFECSLVNPDAELQPTEHTALRWLHPKDLRTLKWTPADAEAVELIATRTA